MSRALALAASMLAMLPLALPFAPLPAHAQTYTMTASWPVPGNNTGARQFISDGTIIYTVNFSTGSITGYDANGSVLSTWQNSPGHVEGFDSTNNLLVLTTGSKDSLGTITATTLTAYTPSGAIVYAKSFPFAIQAVSRQGYLFGPGDNDSVNEYGPDGTLIGPVNWPMGTYYVSWDDYAVVYDSDLGYSHTIQVNGTGGTFADYRVCDRCIEQNCYQYGIVATDGQGGMFVSANYSRRDSTGFCIEFDSVDRWVNNQRVARFDAWGYLATDSHGAVYVFTGVIGKPANMIQKWEPSNSTAARRETWGAVKSRWR